MRRRTGTPYVAAGALWGALSGLVVAGAVAVSLSAIGARPGGIEADAFAAYVDLTNGPSAAPDGPTTHAAYASLR